MAFDWTDITKKDVSKGIDSYSQPTNIQEGYAEDILNHDADANGSLPKRKGYVGYRGYVPVRVKAISHSGTEISFTLDDSQAIDLLSTLSSPLVAYGKLDSSVSASGDFTSTNACRYYSTFQVDNKDSLSAGSGTLPKTTSQHGLSTQYIFVGLAESDSTINASNTVLIPDGVSINETTYNIDIDYTIVADADVYFYYADKSAESGVTYINEIAGGSAATSHTITAGTHGLSNFNIGVKCFDDLNGSGEITEIIPDDITIDNSGEVIVTFNSNFPSAAGGTGYITLTACPITNINAGTADPGVNTTFTFAVEDEFNFYYVYYYDAGDSLYHAVIPDEISYDADTGMASVTYALPVSSESVEVYWEPAQIVANKITVTDTTATSESYTSSIPQITLWGLNHDEIYKSSATKGGHVTHIDSYSSSGDTHLVCGLGGNLFKAQSRTEAGETTYRIPTAEVNMRERVNATGSAYVAPLFDTTGSSVTRTRTLITDDSIENNKALVTTAAYVSSGVVDYTLTFTSKSGTITDGNEIDVGYDKLTVSGMANSVHNGTFIISSIQSDSATSTVIRCTNSGVLNDTTDESDALGRAGVFTDKIDVENAPPFIGGDVLLSSVLSSSGKTISNVNGTSIYLSSITSEIEFPDGVRVYVSRSSSIVPLRQDEVADVTDFVRGDMVDFSLCGSEVRIKSIVTAADTAITITGTGTVATATFSAAHGYGVGQKLFIYGTTNNYDGEITIASVPSSTTLTFSSTTTASDSGYVLGKCVEIDTTLTIYDRASPSTFNVEGRFIPIEAPTNDGDLPKETYVYHLDTNDYDAQVALRSCMASDNMYLTNQADEVYKYDGSSLYRASLPRWQPQLFVQFDTTTASLLKGFTVGYDNTSVTAKSFTLTSGAVFSVGDRVYDVDTDTIFTVSEIAEYDVIVSGDTSSISTGGTDILTLVKTYKYYARLNIIDVNDNIIASAATGYNDMIVEQVADGQFHLKLVGMPTFDNYDYDRIEVELYRTAANTRGPFYLVKRKTITADNNDGYIEFNDGTPDTSLVTLDSAHSALLGIELGTAWNQPSRAKYITSIGNRLALANTKGYPKLDVTMLDNGASVTAANIAGFTYLIRKDNTDTSTTTNMVDRVKYEMKNSGATSILPTQTASTVDAAVAGDVIDNSGIQFNDTAHGFTTGMKVQLTTTDTLPTGLSLATDYYIIRVDADNYKFATSIANAGAGTAISWTDDGVGVHTVTPQHNITRTSTNFTIEAYGHGLAAGNWVYLYHASPGTNNDLQFAGWWQVASAATNSFTITWPNSTTVSLNDIDSFVTATTKTDVPVWVGTDGNYNQRDGNTSGSIEYIAALRLSNAINASMAMTNIAISGQETFVPWMLCGGGNDYNYGQFVIEFPTVLSTTPEMKLGTVASTFRIYVNGVNRSSSEEVSSATFIAPSRVLLSYPNYPEVFDNPEGSGDGVVDINASDGQAITGIIPFYGKSSFGGAQLNEILVVFKEHSIYLLNTTSLEYQRIDSRGLGCTAPYSIAPSKNGIIFANESGIYRLDRNMEVSYVGKYMQGKWKGSVNKSALSEATATQYGIGRQYKLSVPISSSSVNSEVYVYSHDREGVDVQFGAWTRYDNHPVKGWANQDNDSFFASTSGDVFKIRNDSTVYDYRDDASAISSTILLKPEDFDLPSVRKVVRAVSSLLKYSSTSGINVLTSINLSGIFESAGSIVNSSSDRGEPVRSSVGKRKCTYIQVKYTHSTIDEEFTLSGVVYTVGRIDIRGTRTAEDYS